MIKVLITEDSPVVRKYLEHILNADPDIQVVGTAKDGKEAVDMVSERKPDVVSMDIHMPGMDGFEATRLIMETYPVPIVICSASWDAAEVDKTFKAMEAGAVGAVTKPLGIGTHASEAHTRDLVNTVKTMSKVKVVRRWTRLRKSQIVLHPPVRSECEQADSRSEIKVVGIGASTGGPIVLKTILSALPKPFLCPVVIVQHIAAGFLSGLGEWLTKTTGFPVQVAVHRQRLMPGIGYLAPDSFQMGIDKQLRAVINTRKEENNLCPSVSFLFRSMADVLGTNGIGVLLTGMGKDGAQQLKSWKEKGGITIVQDKESSVVYGMPGEAIKLGAAKYILPPEEIAWKLTRVVGKSQNGSCLKLRSKLEGIGSCP